MRCFKPYFWKTISTMAIEPIDDMPKITLEKDDVESFQRARAQAKVSTKKQQRESQNPPTKSPSWFSLLFLLVVISGSMIFWSVQQQKVLTLAQERITELERRLSATGEEMDQSAVALQVKVTELSKKTEELWQQMDKLWASAWRRNQSEIADLNKSLRALTASTEKQIKSMSDSDVQQQNKTHSLENQLGQYAQALQQAQDTLTQLKVNSDANEQQLSSLREKLISTALGNNNLTNKIDDLESKVNTLETKVSATIRTSPTPP